MRDREGGLLDKIGTVLESAQKELREWDEIGATHHGVLRVTKKSSCLAV